MNRLNGIISNIEHNDSISLVDVSVESIVLSATLLETPSSASYLRIGAPVTLLFKETEVSLAKNLQGQLSLRNRIPANLLSIELGAILSAVTLQCFENKLVSVITTRAVKQLNLNAGDMVEALVKANEIALMAGHHAD
jgi:molybdopterin-binding protein